MKDNRRDFIKKSALLLGAVSTGGLSLAKTAPITGVAPKMPPIALDTQAIPNCITPEEMLKIFQQTGVMYYNGAD